MTATTVSKKEKPTWAKTIRQYQNSNTWVSIWQVLNSFVPFVVLWFLAYLALDVSYLLTLGLALLASGFAVRIFIIQHDCGHGSFFKNQKWNNRLGAMCGILSMTPYDFWRHSHAIHHAHNGDLDFRGIGDVYTMTVKEFQGKSPRERLLYRLFRNPILMFVVGPPLMFMVKNRTPFALPEARHARGVRSIIFTDIALILTFGLLAFIFGPLNVLLVHLPIVWFTSSIGVFLFFVQHQYEDAYWSQKPEWDYASAALEGSSYFKMPKILQFFTGNIGLHHVHHLSPRIPNYLLQKAHDENPEFQEVVTLSIWDSVKIAFIQRLSLWDEEQQRLINFREYHRRYVKNKAETVEAPAEASEVTA